MAQGMLRMHWAQGSYASFALHNPAKRPTLNTVEECLATLDQWRNTVNYKLLRNAFDHLVAARERQAQRYVSDTLARFEQDTLRSLGHTRDLASRNGPILRK